MQPQPKGEAGLQAADLTPALLQLLGRFPRREAPGAQSESTRHLLSMTERANGTQLRHQLLRSFLSTV